MQLNTSELFLDYDLFSKIGRLICKKEDAYISEGPSGSEGTGRLKSEVRSRARQAEGADRGRVRAGGRGRSCNLTPGSTGPGVNTKHY